jgi:hypothetical protein
MKFTKVPACRAGIVAQHTLIEPQSCHCRNCRDGRYIVLLKQGVSLR